METKIDANVGTRYLAQGVVLNKRYTITKYLASGGFGHTYLATNTMGMQVVIKEFYISGVCSRDKDSRSVIVSVDDNKELYIKQKSKFIREAQRIYSLSHPNIVKVMDAFEENDTAYYVMDYIDGQSLAQMQKPIREDVVIHYLRQILSALEYVHNVDLLHLDIKPSNIMIDSHGNAILIDFGASKQLDPTSNNQSLLSTTGIAYTPGYASIEQLNNNMKGLGTHSDIYSLGATLYNILTGQNPPLPSEIMDEGFPTFPKMLSASMCSLIYDMMKVASKERLKNVAEIKRKYWKLLGFKPEGGGSGNKKGLIWAGIAIVTILFLVGVIVAQQIYKDDEEPTNPNYIAATSVAQENSGTSKTANSRPAKATSVPQKLADENLTLMSTSEQEAEAPTPATEAKKSRDGKYVYNGYFTDGNEKWAVKIKFTLKGNSVSNCSYENVAMGLKPVAWNASFDGSRLTIYGKNHGNPMTIYLQFDDESGNSMSGTVGDMRVKLYR